MSEKTRSHWPISVLTGATSIISFLLPVVMVKRFSAADVGIFRIFFLYLMTVPAFSLSSGILNGIFFWSGRSAEGKETLKSAWSVLFILSWIAPLLGVFFTPWVAHALGWPERAWVVFLIAAIPTISVNFYEFSAIANGRIWAGAIFQASFEVFRAVVLLVVLIQTQSLMSVLWAHAMVAWSKALLGFFLGMKQGLNPIGLHFSKWREVIRYALPVSVSAVFDQLVQYSDRFILSAFLLPAQYAVYSIGCLSIPPLLILEQSVHKVLIPQLSEDFHKNDIEGAARHYRAALDELWMILIPSMVGLMVFAQAIIRLLFTVRYEASADYLRLYAVFYLLISLPYDVVPRARGESNWIFRTSLLFGVLALLSGWIGVRSCGAFGALIAFLVGQALLRIYGFMKLKSALVGYMHLLLPLRAGAFYFGYSLLLAGATYGVKPYFTDEKIWFLVTAPIFAVFYLSGTLLRKKHGLFSFI